MKTFDLFLACVYFEDTHEYKIRPVMCISDNGKYIQGRKITSKPKRNNYPGEFEIEEWQQAGLKEPSVVRMSKYVTIPKRDVKKFIGHLTLNDIRKLSEFMDTPYKESYNEDDVIDSYVYEQFVNI